MSSATRYFFSARSRSEWWSMSRPSVSSGSPVAAREASSARPPSASASSSRVSARGADSMQAHVPSPAPASAPAVSVGMPVYNGERHLHAAIDSILAQTLQDFELIIADNASTDGTADICKEYARRDARIRYFRHPSNIGAPRNYTYLV